MRLPAILYLVGMGLLLIGERMIGGEDWKRWAFDGLGLVALLGTFVMIARARAKVSEDQRSSHSAALTWAGVGVTSVLIYALGTDEVLRALAFSEEGERRFSAAVTALWMIVWLAGTLPMLAVDRALATSPVMVTPGRAREASLSALATALALAMIFPLNFLGTRHNKRWDLGYFKTAEPGESTRNIVGGLNEPIRAVLFFPSSSDVTQEIRTYFDALSATDFEVEYADQALDPELAKELKVRENGMIAFVRGEGDDQQTETIKIGVEFDSAKRNLKKLDEKVQEALLKLTRGKKTAYVTVGHGEMYWKAGEPKDRTIDVFKKSLGTLQYKVKELGVATGLAQEIPDDAAFVAILGPSQPFLDEEIATLDAYRRAGGSLLIAIAPGGPDLSALIGPLGLTHHDDILASDQNIAVITRRKIDHLNIATNKFSTHESVTTLSRNSKALPVLLPLSGYLEEGTLPEGVKQTFTVRSLPDAWNDLNRNLDFDPPEEKRQGWPMIAAVSGPAEKAADAPEATPEAAPDAIADPAAPAADAPEPDAKAPDAKDEKKDDKKAKDADKGDDAGFRVVVTSGSAWLSDFFLPNVQGNLALLQDTVAWLSDDAAMAGTTNSEEDVKLVHNKEGQDWIFYGTSFLVPLAFLSGGLIRVRSRRKRGAV